ncbi:hypothetical protein KEM54_001221 [Ascosphaera aggregata]|nr:hypothetical protein KEM54_001221 [Ascosphaera aggregata]
MDNRNIPESSKQHARDLLRKEASGSSKNRIQGGLKAATKNPNVTEEGGKEARQTLEVIESTPSAAEREEEEEYTE